MQCKRYEDFMREYQYYRTFLWNYRKTGRPFKDHYFHPNMNINEYKVNLDPKKIEWRRVDEFYKAPLFDEKLISIEYVKQGTLGDCYFVSALSRIAKQPELVSKLFDKTVDTILGKVKKSINIKCGAVVIFFHAFGRETPVLIDTRLPFYKGTSDPIFSHPANHHASPWFCLVEKAYAKLFGSYSNISGGNFTDSIYSLFGYQPLMKYFSELTKEQKVTKKPPFKRILEYQNQGGVMSVAIDPTKTQKSSNEIKSVGLVSNHSYLLIKAVDHKGMHFFHLRNPWGKFEWKGDWSDNSPLWTKELKEALRFKKSDDGSFWMIEKDFLKYFTYVDVSRPIPPTWHSKTFSMQMWPGDTDGIDPESGNAKLDKRPNYAIKISKSGASSQKVPLFFLIERRSYFPDKVTMVNHKASKFQIVFAHSNGKKLSSLVLKTSSRFYLNCTKQITYTKYTLNNPKDTLTIVVQRLEKRPEFEECSIRVSCQYEFSLYNIGKPKDLIEDNDNTGKVFTSITGVHKMVQGSSKSDKKIQKFFKNKNGKENDDKKVTNENHHHHHQHDAKDKDQTKPKNQGKQSGHDHKHKHKKIKITNIQVRDVKMSDDDDSYESDDGEYETESETASDSGYDDDSDESTEDESEEDDEEENDEDEEKRELSLEERRITREINDIGNHQAALQDEINKLEDQADKEDDEKKIAQLNKKIEMKRNKLFELEEMLNSLLKEIDENEKEIEKTKRMKRTMNRNGKKKCEGGDKKQQQKPKPKKDGDASGDDERDKKSKPKQKVDSDDKNKKPKPKPKLKAVDGSEDDDESGKKPKSRPKQKQKVFDDSEDDEESGKKSKPKQKQKPKVADDSEDDEESGKKPKSKQKQKQKVADDSEDDEESGKKSKPKQKQKQKVADDGEDDEESGKKQKPKQKPKSKAVDDSEEDDEESDKKRKSKPKVSDDEKNKKSKPKSKFDDDSSDDADKKPKQNLKRGKDNKKIKTHDDDEDDTNSSSANGGQKMQSKPKKSYKPKVVPA